MKRQHDYGINFLSAIFLVTTFAGCATIMTGTSQQMQFNSNPEGATVRVDGLEIGKTPLTAPIKKKSSGPVISFTKDGYKPLKKQLDSQTTGWFWGNILIGGFFGSTTDNVSGAMNEYTPHQYIVTLQPLGTSPVEAPAVQPNPQKAREFILVNYDALLQDLKNGDGDYLSSLIGLLNAQSDDRELTIKKIRILSEAYSERSQFADQVVTHCAK